MEKGTWSEWEWENPPMAMGTEYRTTERWQGKVVYTKLIDFGNLPSGGEKEITGVLPSEYRIIRCQGSTSDNWAMPLLSVDGRCDVTAFGTTIRMITTKSAYSYMTAAVQLWYVKG